ncbi:ABC transporter ATP-binding protein [Magnetovirga frankeli]|uniref:ABC transporter ATP-binding protein n=1 Tax=Magnetovirga frankeli TaxID=947516 RepID=UPI001292E3B7|nr:ABC transporter ATP-binding protein [gamma proteobacterium SS-5]
MSDDVLVRVEGVGKKFCRDLKKSLWYGMKDIAAELLPGERDLERHATLRPGEFWAVDDVSFELRRGECLGLIGRNGAGKTTLLKMLNGLIKPDKGRIEIRGRVSGLIALGAGFNPILTGRENIYVNGSVLGLKKAEIDKELDRIVEFADLQTFIDAPVQTYSSGMAVRLGFAIASSLRPEVLLIDEVLAVGDASFRTKCYNRIFDLRDYAATIFVSHSMAQVAKICDVGLLLNQGRMVGGKAPVRTTISQYCDHLPFSGAITEGSNPYLIRRVVVLQENKVSLLVKSIEEARFPSAIDPLKELTFEVLFASHLGANPIQVLWSFIDPEQNIVCQVSTELQDVSFDKEPPTLTTSVKQLNLNSGAYSLSLQVFEIISGSRTEMIAGWRDFAVLSVSQRRFLGTAPVILEAPARRGINPSRLPSQKSPDSFGS